MDSLPPIVIVDDDPDHIFILTRLLRKGGVQNRVIGFEEPRPACAYLKAEGEKENSPYFPLIVFTDLQMPAMDGCLFTTWIRSFPATANLPVFMVTASGSVVDRERAMIAGVTRIYDKYPTASVLAQIAKTYGCGIIEQWNNDAA